MNVVAPNDHPKSVSYCVYSNLFVASLCYFEYASSVVKRPLSYDSVRILPFSLNIIWKYRCQCTCMHNFTYIYNTTTIENVVLLSVLLIWWVKLKLECINFLLPSCWHIRCGIFYYIYNMHMYHVLFILNTAVVFVMRLRYFFLFCTI